MLDPVRRLMVTWGAIIVPPKDSTKFILMGMSDLKGGEVVVKTRFSITKGGTFSLDTRGKN